MHRQSLGSPKHGEHLSSETQKQSSPPSSSGSGDEVKKSMRPIPMAPETYIHLIPMLTLLCFLILYLSSHRPSPIDLAEFSLPEALSNRAELRGIQKPDTLAIRSLKNSDHEPSGRAKHRLLHRKIPHFNKWNYYWDGLWGYCMCGTQLEYEVRCPAPQASCREKIL